jgi:hypothetical protein
MNDVVAEPQIRHEKAFVDALHRPPGVGEFLAREEEHARTGAFRLAKELLALEVGGEGQDGRTRGHMGVGTLLLRRHSDVVDRYAALGTAATRAIEITPDKREPTR